ncbi:MAG: ABC transporter permease [Thalassobaculaceae bacterium]|nr:ABC transporter permease [Thalassobaculaceae bacterium]
MADGTPLKVALARATRRSKIRALLLVAPLLVFILITFIFPIVDMLMRSIDNPEVNEAIPLTVAELDRWDGEGMPPSAVFSAFVQEMGDRSDEQRRNLGRMGARLNYEDGGFRSLVNKSQRAAAKIQDAPLQFALVGFDKGWEDKKTWPTLDTLAETADFADVLPTTAEQLRAWETGSSPFAEKVPGAETFSTILSELATAAGNGSLDRLLPVIKAENKKLATLIEKTGAQAGDIEANPLRYALMGVDKAWGQPDTWKTIKNVSSPVTASYYLNAVDRTYDSDGNIVMQPEWKQIYVHLFMKTIYVSLGVTLACLILAYPISYLLATLPSSKGNLLLILVLLPFWTSLLVRTTSWIVLLQTQGVINDTLVFLGLISDDNRIEMIYNMTGTIIAMTHILLPFMVLPMYSVMKTISPSYMRAARSLGANPLIAFVRVYMPQTVPGIGAGSILVFILAIGYYITPALVGGQDGQLISNFIAYHMQKSLNWGLAAALGTVLLSGVLVLYWLYDRLVGIDNMKLG